MTRVQIFKLKSQTLLLLQNLLTEPTQSSPKSDQKTFAPPPTPKPTFPFTGDLQAAGESTFNDFL